MNFFLFLAFWSIWNNGATIYSFQFEEITKVHMNDLSTSDFETKYLNQKPIILTGTTACPNRLNFENIHDYCKGKNRIPGNYIHTKMSFVDRKETNKNENIWAGLKEGNKSQHIPFLTWVKSMKEDEEMDKDPEFAFDLPMAELCPALMSQVYIPKHFVGIFANQYTHRYERYLAKKNSQRRKHKNGPKTTEQLRGNSIDEIDEINLDHHNRSMNDKLDDDIDMNEICANLPFYNMYLADKFFQTDLHIDAFHSAFIASMCVGRKKWRIMTNVDYAKVYSIIGDYRKPSDMEHSNGRLINNETYVLGSIFSPFYTWDDNTTNTKKTNRFRSFQYLKHQNVTIYEGVLNPGEILYIPAGAPHAALTLDKSIMVASNDHTFQNLIDAVTFCDQVNNNHVTCPGFRHKLHSMYFSQDEDTHSSSTSTATETSYLSLKKQYNYYKKKQKHTLITPNQSMISLPVSTGCESTYELLKTYDTSPILWITPQNLESILLKEKSIIILKSQKNCGFCLYLLHKWETITKGFNPPVQFGVLHCFQGQCLHGENKLYQQLVHRFEDRLSPEFQWVQLNPNNNLELTFIDFYGSFTTSFDNFRVWVSLHSGSWIDVQPLWWKHLLQCFHWSIAILDSIFKRVGVFGMFFIVLVLTFMIMMAWDYLMNIVVASNMSCLGNNRKNTTNNKKHV